MKAGIVFLPNGHAELCVNLDDEVELSPHSEWTDSDVLAFADLVRSYPVVSGDPEIQANYLNMRFAGESHNMAEMLATRSFPGVKTDAIFNEGKFSGDAGRIGVEELWLRSQAEAVGVSTTGKWYCRGLANFPGDPTAWVGDRGDVLRVAEAKNMRVHGYVEHTNHESDPGEDVVIADDLIDNEVADILDSNPGLDPIKVRDEVFALRTGAVDNNPLNVGDYTQDDLDNFA